MSIAKAIGAVAKLARNASKAAPAAKEAASGAERTKAFTDKLGRHYPNGRGGKKATQFSTDPKPMHPKGTPEAVAAKKRTAERFDRIEKMQAKPAVDAHVQSLEKVLHTSAQQFAQTMAAMQANKALTADAWKAMAKQFAGVNVKSKKQAIQKITARRANIDTSRAKSNATNGRSAA